MTTWTDPTFLVPAAVAAAVTALWMSVRARRRERELLAELAEQESLVAAANEAQQAAKIEVAGLQATVQSLHEGRQDVEKLREQLRAQFAEDASKVLDTTSRQFLELADSKLQGREQTLGEQLSKRQEAISETLKPFQEQLTKIEALTREIDGKRESAMGNLLGKLATLDEATGKLRTQSEALVATLRGNVGARGRWGEQTLRRVAELGGLVELCDFVEQETSGDARPDMIVRLPNQGQVPVDAKAPLDHYLKAHDSQDPKQQEVSLRAHAEAVRGHVRALAKRDYPAKLGIEHGLTIMFLPTEAMLARAIEHMPDLFEEAQRNKVLLATPMTLLAMLKTIAVFWHQNRMLENANQIATVARELYERVATFQEHMEKVGKGLQSASTAFQAAASSYERRIVPTGRRLAELGGAEGAKREIAELPEIGGPTPGAVLPMPAKEAGA